VVVGAGGYVSGPVLLTAALMKVPTLVMESNAVPGFTNRRLALFVDVVAVSFEESLRYFRGKGVVTGNPVRREFFEIERKGRDPRRFSLLVFGGSQGARAINEALVAALPLLERHKDVLSIVHQTGESDFEKVRGGYDAAGWTERADVRKYIDDMVARFAESDLVVCRAGATMWYGFLASLPPAAAALRRMMLENRDGVARALRARAADVLPGEAVPAV